MREKPTNAHQNIWEHLPTVILTKKIKKEKWAKTARVNLTIEKNNWVTVTASGTVHWEPQINISIPYKKMTIDLHIEWEHKNSRGTIKDRFKIESYTTMLKAPRYSKTYAGAISKMADLILIILPILDAENQRIIELKEYKKTMATARKKLKNEFSDISLVEIADQTLEYKASKSYSLNLRITEETGTYYIHNIQGRFTIDELRQIIKIVGTNPRAVAERLLQ